MIVCAEPSSIITIIVHGLRLRDQTPGWDKMYLSCRLFHCQKYKMKMECFQYIRYPVLNVS